MSLGDAVDGLASNSYWQSCRQSRRFKVCILVRSGSVAPVFDAPLDWLKLRPGDSEGEFSCCRLNHRINDVSIECDKPKLREVLDRFVRGKVKALRDQGNESDWRFTFAIRKYFSRGLLDKPNSESMLGASGSLPKLEEARVQLGWYLE